LSFIKIFSIGMQIY